MKKYFDFNWYMVISAIALHGDRFYSTSKHFFFFTSLGFTFFSWFKFKQITEMGDSSISPLSQIEPVVCSTQLVSLSHVTESCPLIHRIKTSLGLSSLPPILQPINGTFCDSINTPFMHYLNWVIMFTLHVFEMWEESGVFKIAHC